MVEIPDSIDGHDAIRVDNRVFVADTRHGDIVEVALPASAFPFTDITVDEHGAERIDDPLAEAGRDTIGIDSFPFFFFVFIFGSNVSSSLLFTLLHFLCLFLFVTSSSLVPL